MITARSTIRYEYNDQGRLIGTLLQALFPITSRRTTSYEYNDQGRLIGTLFEGYRADGTVGFIQQTTLTYDDRGNLVRRVIDSDSDANGTWDSRITFSR